MLLAFDLAARMALADKWRVLHANIFLFLDLGPKSKLFFRDSAQAECPG
jgi:hypothetical protein